MNNTDSTSKSGLFLIELILSIFFFIVAMAVCLQLFAKAHTLSQDTVSVNKSVLFSQNLAELFLGNGGDFHAVKAAYETQDCISICNTDAATHLLLLFDKEWQGTTDSASARYFVYSVYTAEDSFSYEDIYVAKGAPTASLSAETISDYKVLHHLQVKKYKGGAAN